MKKIRVSVPGRICLFGEHQDYLKLPVITAAINLRVAITGSTDNSGQITLHLPDINTTERIEINQSGKEYKYIKERDYFRSAINILLRKGIKLPPGCECTVNGNIPINSGTSSSSALTVAWCQFLWEMDNRKATTIKKDPTELASEAYLAEVKEFDEPGGMMDHYATTVGGILYQEFDDEVTIKRLNTDLGSFVLGDSLEPKDTKGILKRVKIGVLEAVKLISNKFSDFDLFNFKVSDIDQILPLLNDEQKEVFEGALLNRDITQIAYKMFMDEKFNHTDFGRHLNEHQEILDKNLKISTPKINHMLNSAMKAGAYGGKINGSGGGGCMFCYAPEDPERVANTINDAGGSAYIIRIDEGIKVQKES